MLCGFAATARTTRQRQLRTLVDGGSLPLRHGDPRAKPDIFGIRISMASTFQAQKRSREAKLDAIRAAAKDLDEMIASWGATEDELMDEYKQIHRSAREKKRNAK